VGKAFVTTHPILTFYALTFVISWGGFLGAGGPGFLAGTSWQSDPRFQLAILAMLAGPPVAGVALTALVSGSSGLRELISRLLRWRADVRWFVVALVIAPVAQVAVLLALSILSPEFYPAILTADRKASLLLLGVVVGLAGGLAEELGWTGFVVPRMWRRYGILATGLIVGALWGTWHLLQMLWVGSTSSANLPIAAFLLLFILFGIAQLTAYRVLMTWIYDRTESLLVAVLMHASYIFTTLFVFAPPTTGLPFLTYSVAFTIILWGIVAAVGMANRGRFTRQSNPAPTTPA
jgi:membrane protease YdiL (CAAX protease family)